MITMKQATSYSISDFEDPAMMMLSVRQFFREHASYMAIVETIASLEREVGATKPPPPTAAAATTYAMGGGGSRESISMATHPHHHHHHHHHQRHPQNNNNNNNYHAPPTRSVAATHNTSAAAAAASAGSTWKTPKLKKTVFLDKSKNSSVDESIQCMCVAMNKITANNYDTQKESVLRELLIGDDDGEGDGDVDAAEADAAGIAKRVKKFFDIVMLNKSSSSNYAALFLDILQHCVGGRAEEEDDDDDGDQERRKRREAVARDRRVSMGDSFLAGFMGLKESFRISFDEIKCVDPNLDYDGYCAYVKKNEHRKACALFMINLFQKLLQYPHRGGSGSRVFDDLQIGLEDIARTVLSLQEVIASYIAEDGRTNDVEEIVEVLFLFVTLCYAEMKSHATWTNDIFPKLKTMAAYKARDFKSLSSRSIFKIMDIVDFIKKQK